MENKNIDQFFKDKADKRSFDFDESYWSEMEVLMDKDNDPPVISFWIRQKGLIAWASLFLLISTMLGGLWMSRSTTFSVKNASDSSSENHSIIDRAITENDNQNTENTNSISVIAPPIIKNKEANQPIIKNDYVNNTEKVSQSQSANDRSTTVANQPNKGKTSLNNPTKTSLESKQSLNNRIKNNKGNSSTSNPVNPVDVNPLNNKLDQENTKDNEKNPSPIIPIAQNPMVQPAENIAFLYTLPLTDLHLLTDKIGNAQTYPFKEDKETEKNSMRPNLTYGAIAGVNFYRGFLNVGEKREVVANDFFGGVYAKIPLVENKWTAQVGLNYWQRGALNSAIQTDSTVYGFGVTTFSRKVNIHQLQYIQMPIHLIRTYKQSHFLMGVSANYLLNAKGTLQRTMVSDFETREEIPTPENGYQSAYNPFDITLNLGYERSVYNKLNIGIAAQIGFVDISNNAIFENMIYDNNLQCRVYLSYDLK